MYSVLAEIDGPGPHDGTSAMVSSQVLVSDGSQVVTIGGTAYTLQPDDNGLTFYFTSGSAITLSVPPGLGASFACAVIQGGAGQITPTAVGTTINNRQSFTQTAGQFAYIALVAVAADFFILSGDAA